MREHITMIPDSSNVKSVRMYVLYNTYIVICKTKQKKQKNCTPPKKKNLPFFISNRWRYFVPNPKKKILKNFPAWNSPYPTYICNLLSNINTYIYT